MPRLSVIIVNTNTRNWLETCLKSLEKQDIFNTIEVVVVENGSTDGSAEMVSQNFPTYKLIQLDETIGFGQANNRGAQNSTAPILLFLNPDTMVCEKSLGAFLPVFEEHPQCGAAGGIVYDGDGELECSTGSFPTLITLALNRLLTHFSPARPIFGRYAYQHWTGYDRPRKVGWVTGAYLWIRREIFENIGGFDEHIFLYCEDVDLCYQVYQLGYECWFFPRAPMVHYRSKAPVPRPRKKMQREYLLYFANKNYRSPKFWLIRSILWIMSKL